ncbi:MAG: class I SAM-dependent methyltransferase [Caldisericaceae bacterium]|nr:class I SAM-dependent methyltransferase [Caldisericaceae bacterium]
MDWTKNYFDEFYLRYFLQTQKEEITKKQINFIAKFFDAETYLLDAGCGIGRHTLLLGEQGFKTLGIDSSPLYIKLATAEAKKRGLKNVQFIQQDIRKLSFQYKFNGILSLWSSFGYFDDDTNFDILKRFYNSLKKEGKLIIDIENRDYILKHFVHETFKEKEDIFILERRHYLPLTSIVTTHRFIVGKDLREEYLRKIRIYSATEMVNLYRSIGFKNIKVFGDYAGKKFSEDSKRIIIIGEKS